MVCSMYAPWLNEGVIMLITGSLLFIASDIKNLVALAPLDSGQRGHIADQSRHQFPGNRDLLEAEVFSHALALRRPAGTEQIEPHGEQQVWQKGCIDGSENLVMLVDEFRVVIEPAIAVTDGHPVAAIDVVAAPGLIHIELIMLQAECEPLVKFHGEIIGTFPEPFFDHA